MRILNSLVIGNKDFRLMFVIFLAAITVGVIAVLYSEAFIYGTLIARKRFTDYPSIIFITTPVFFVLGAWLCRKFAPNAAGSGPEHVLGALKKLAATDQKDTNVAEYLSLRVLMVKILSSLVCIAGGGALGREGPVVQISASIFVIVAQKIKHITPNFDMRAWIIAGSAAGLAAAFNTPLAGIVFAIEELSQFHVEQKFSSFKTKAFFAVLVSGVTAQFITGSYVLFDFQMMHFKWEMMMALVLLLVASICGFFAFILKSSCNKLTTWRNGITGKKWFLIPIAAGLLVALVSYTIGINSFGAGMFALQDSLQSGYVITMQDTIGRFVNVIATYASGCAGGLLLPALALGAGVGAGGSLLLPMEDSRIFIATGMASFLGALLNAPLTAAVLVLEVTNQRELILPLFLATLTASWIFQICNNNYTKIFTSSEQTPVA